MYVHDVPMQQRDIVDWRSEVPWRWRLVGEQQDTLSEKSYIRAEEFLPFLPASFVILWRALPYSSHQVLCHCPDLGTDKRGERRGQGAEGYLRGKGGREAGRKPCFYSSWCCFYMIKNKTKNDLRISMGSRTEQKVEVEDDEGR